MNLSIQEFSQTYSLEESWCHVVNYSLEIGVLIAEISPVPTTKERFYIYFNQALYFSGSLKWKGVAFKAAPNAQCKELIKLISKSDNMEYLQLMIDEVGYKLLEVDSSLPQVQILCANISISNNNIFQK